MNVHPAGGGDSKQPLISSLRGSGGLTRAKVGRSVADVFISYSRADSEFVQQIASSLHELGRTPWVDTAGISDAEVFPQAIRTAIEESDAFLFVITPASVASRYCDQEADYARTLAKRIVPVLREPVPDAEIPEEIRNRNWIPFTDSDDYDASLARVVHALDTDLELRREHTRILVKALEWDHENKERSLLLRGAELKAAEGWLARIGPGADQASTAVQRDYVLASRRAATRRGRIIVGVSVGVAVIALGLGVVALVSRNQAVSSDKSSQALALAAESQNDLSADPEVSVILAQEAVRLKPIPRALAALRQAMDTSALRVALPTVAPEQCGFESGPSAAYSPSGSRVAETLCTGELVVMDSANGRVLLRRHVATQASAVAYEPNGHLLAVGTNRGIDLVDPRTGLVRWQLIGHGMPNALAFNHAGTLLGATTNLGTTVWDLSSRTPLFSLSDPDNDRTLAFTPTGGLLIVGTGHAYTEVLAADSGQVIRLLRPPASQDPTDLVDPIALAGDTLVVGTNDDPPYPPDVDGAVDVWDTRNWNMLRTWATVTGFSFSDLALSPDGQRVAYGLDDGTGGIWGYETVEGYGAAEEYSELEGQTAEVNTIAFSPNGDRVVDADDDGTARIYFSKNPWLASITTPIEWCEDGYFYASNQFAWQHDNLVGIVASGADIFVRRWSLPSGRELPGSVLLSSNGVETCSALSSNGRLAAVWNDAEPDSPVRVMDVASRRLLLTLPAMPVDGLAFSQDGRLLVVNDGRGGLYTTTLTNGRTTVSHGWPTHCAATQGEAAPSAVAISDDDRLEAVASFCGLLRIGHTGAPGPFETFDEHERIGGRIAFNPAGTQLALDQWDSSATVISVATDRRALELLGHTRDVDDVVYSPVGDLMATTSFDNTLRSWNASTGQLLQTDPDNSFTHIPLFSPDGRYVIEVNLNYALHVWPACPDCLDPSALLEASRSSVVSQLTTAERAEVAAAGG
jgi:WD40 repeat protein